MNSIKTFYKRTNTEAHRVTMEFHKEKGVRNAKHKSAWIGLR